MSAKLRILILEDRPADAELMLREVRRAGYEPNWKRVQKEPDYVAQLDQGWEIILADYSLPQFTGLRALELLKERGLDIPLIIVSGTIGEDVAVAAVKVGANDYVMKNKLARLGPAVERELRDAVERRERKRAEKDLRVQSAALTAAANAIVIANRDGTIVWVNPAFTSLTGYALAEAVGKNPRDLVKSGQQKRAVYEQLWQTILAGRVWHGELINRRKDGSLYLEDQTITPVRDAAGEITHFISIKQDLTERKQVERQAAGEQRVLESLARGAPLSECLNLLARECEALYPGLMCSVLLLDAAGRHLRHGAAPSLPADYIAAIDGIEIGPCVGSCGTAAHTGRAVIVSDIATDPLWAGCKELVLPHGLHACWSMPILGAEGRVLGTLALYSREPRAPQPKELAALERAAYLASLAILRHRMFEALRQSEVRYRLLFDFNPLPMWVYELESLRFLAVNEAAVQHYGYTREEFLGMTIKEIRPPEDIPALLKFIEQGGTEHQKSGEFRHRQKDGTIIQVEIISRPIVFDDRDARLVLANDITEQKLLHEKFLHAQRLESLGMLASGIAHDLNNILAPILFVGPLLRQSRSGPDDLQLIAMLESNAARGAGLVKQILAFSHGSTGEPRLTEVRHVVSDIVKLIDQTFPKSILLDHDIPQDLWPAVINPTQIHQVLLNLCVNARDAMPCGGTLRVSAANRQLDHEEAEAIPGGRPGSWLVSEVGDTGTGIPPEVLERIWEPFFTTKASGNGTGLGLSTVRGIVASHLGFIQLETAAGKGTTFRVFLPAATTELSPVGDVSPAAVPRGDGELILIVDDDQAVREILAAILSQYGYRVVTCADGVEAITRFNVQPGEFALVVTDVDMPHLGGAALARVLLQLRPDVRLLAMSGLSGGGTDGSDVRTIKQMAHAFLLKPFEREELLRAVHRLLHPAETR